jgi:ubiquinone/menaquinone biosynthesis C-methylase UbiE
VNDPRFCLTSDTDWASDFAFEYFLDLVAEFGIVPTVFATHRSAVLDAAEARGAVEIGIHPNLLAGSTQGATTTEVLDHLCGLFPRARSSRSHYFRDDTLLTDELVRRGFTHDSNLCLFMQPDLQPLHHQSGLLRFPVFWEDDVHCRNTRGDWRLDSWLPSFTTPGLKVLNLHPFLLAANVPTLEHYRHVKPHITTLDRATLHEVRHTGDGLDTFVRTLLAALVGSGERFVTLGELYRLHAGAAAVAPAAEPSVTIASPISAGVARGRQTLHSEDEHTRYPTLSDAEKQEFVRREFEDRNPTDPYATSRDYNMRELEIEAIARQLETAPTGRLLDLGCGNGYTLLSLARRLRGWSFTGVDFAQNLIAGALVLQGAETAAAARAVDFVHADAVEYVKRQRDSSVECILTERFLQNLPNAASQKAMLADIHRVLRPGGRLLMCEGSEQGFEGLNDVRAAVGLPRIPATSRENVTAVRFHDADIETHLASLGFGLLTKQGFSTYFLVARVLHPLLVAPSAPRFDARINDEARRVQMHAPFTPGCGGSVLWAYEKRQSAA